MKRSHLILLILFNFLWSAALSIYKVLSEHVPAGSIVTLRFGMAAACMAIFWPWMRGKTPQGKDLLRTILMGIVVFMVGHRIQVLGIKLGTAGNSAVLMGTEPLVTSIAAAIFLREHIGPRRWIGFVLGMFGVALLNGINAAEFGWKGLVASLIFISCFICEAVYSIVGKPLIARADMFKILTLALIFGTIANLLIDGRQTFEAARAMPPNLWWGVAYLAVICTAIGYTLWFIVLADTDVNLAAMTIFAQPLSGVIIAALWLHEPLHLGQLWGSLAIVAGLIIGLSRQIKPA